MAVGRKDYFERKELRVERLRNKNSFNIAINLAKEIDEM